jgi:hypothetical protein
MAANCTMSACCCGLQCSSAFDVHALMGLTAGMPLRVRGPLSAGLGQLCLVGACLL